LQGDHAVVVPVTSVAEQAVLVHAALRKINGARSAVGYLAQLTAWRASGGGVDVRDKNAVGAKIERLLDATAIVVALDAYK
jgi:hypothetical protein